MDYSVPVRQHLAVAIGRFLAMVALAMQLAAASVVPFASLPTAGVDRLLTASICHGDATSSDQGKAPAPHHAPDCAVCPLCQAIHHAGLLLAAPQFALALPAARAIRAFTLPPPRAPPGRRASLAQARAPPKLI